ncbi:MAG: bifunctional proline dehydrogenase/L-glutamate gamma-semialdehyde dehydrogenase PutA [Thalassolituus sp.]
MAEQYRGKPANGDLFRPEGMLRGTLPERSRSDWSAVIDAYCYADETQLIKEFASVLSAPMLQHASREASRLVEGLRSRPEERSLFEQFMQEYSLDNDEGLTLMIIAEALLRIPDKATRDAFIRSEVSHADWDKHLRHSHSKLINLATQGLSLSGRIARLKSALARLVMRPGEPVVRNALEYAMQVLGNQFVLGQTIDDALDNADDHRTPTQSYSFDMLGEAALSDEDAEKYLQAYRKALTQIETRQTDATMPCSLSVKLSALHPRYEERRHADVLDRLGQRLAILVREARSLDIPLTIDAEEADRLQLSLELFSRVLSEEAKGWGKLGLAVQAYGKRALPVLGYIDALAKEENTIIPVRLVKGAYWDTEIKQAQQQGLPGYPVYTRKEHTDISYLACASFMLKSPRIYPQFATHNAHTLMAVAAMADTAKPANGYEFQRLQGMGDMLYAKWLEKRPESVRTYAPVGEHKELLPYLVRRLLENGANTSFVHHLYSENVSADTLTVSPLTTAEAHAFSPASNIPLPSELLSPRRNSAGHNLNQPSELAELTQAITPWLKHQWQARPQVAIAHHTPYQTDLSVISPYTARQEVGLVQWFNPDDLGRVIDAADSAFDRWRMKPLTETGELRKTWLQTLADLLEKNKAELIALCALEAGKTLQDGVDEVREAVDFCRYYASCIGEGFTQPITLPGPTGELNQLHYEGRGVWVCVSPWNFPLAIFIGQVSAALAAGNAVIAKPAEATSLIAARAVELAYDAGVPRDLLQCIPGSGPFLGEVFCNDARIAGVAFTGSHKTAHRISMALSQRRGPLATLIAETGGQNAMIADSTALPEQIVKDVMRSAFTSAGQRCSALRVLYLQNDIADDVIRLLQGAMRELKTGNPLDPATDLGPVISMAAKNKLLAHQRWLRTHGKLICKAPDAPDEGHFLTPVIYEIDSIAQLEEEHFGPILHLVRYSANKLDQVIKDINNTGFGLTLSVHSRNPDTAERLSREIRVGNVYINRDQVGAVVGVQPFGGMKRSGTGPKAGGPDYMKRFACERTITVNTSAIGGNAELLRQQKS